MLASVGSSVKRFFAPRKSAKESRSGSDADVPMKQSAVHASVRSSGQIGDQSNASVLGQRMEMIGKPQCQNDTSPLKKSRTLGEVRWEKDLGLGVRWEKDLGLGSPSSKSSSLNPNQFVQELSPTSRTATGPQLSPSSRIATQIAVQENPDLRGNRNTSEPLDSSVELDPLGALLAQRSSLTRTKSPRQTGALSGLLAKFRKAPKAPVSDDPAAAPPLCASTPSTAANVRISEESRGELLDGIGELVEAAPRDADEEARRLGRPPPVTAAERLAQCEELEDAWNVERAASKEAAAQEAAERAASKELAERAASKEAAKARWRRLRSGTPASESAPSNKGVHAAFFSHKRSHEASSDGASWQRITPSFDISEKSTGSPQYKIPKSFKRSSAEKTAAVWRNSIAAAF